MKRLTKNEPRNQVTDRPPDTKHSQEIAGGKGQELQEQSSVDRQIPTNTKAESGKQGTDTVYWSQLLSTL